jgi:biopolymer transport protein ExbD
MKVRTKRMARVDIAESGALSDLAFLLIVFFIVIAVFNINSGFLLGLPRKDSTKIVNVDEILKVYLSAGGDYLLRGEPVPKDALEEAAKETLRLYPNMTFLLRIHPNTPYQRVVDVIDLVRAVGVENFSFIMAEEGS